MNQLISLICFFMILMCYDLTKSQPNTIENDSDNNRTFFLDSDTLYFQYPNLILEMLGFKPKNSDTIKVSMPFDSIHAIDILKVFHVEMVDSTKFYTRFIKNANQRYIQIKFLKSDTILGSKRITIEKAGIYGNWIYFLIPILLIIIVVVVFRIKFWDNMRKHLKSKDGALFLKKVSDEIKPSIHESKLFKEINDNLSEISKNINRNYAQFLKKFDDFKFSNDRINNYEKTIIDKNNIIVELKNSIENNQQKLKNLEIEYNQFQHEHVEEIKSLNERIKDEIQRKEDLNEKYIRLEKNFSLLKSKQKNVLSHSLLISAIDKKKIERYKDVVKTILKLNQEVPRNILNQSFQNGELLKELNKTVINYFMGSLYSVSSFIDDLENILLNQRTINSDIIGKFGGSLSVGFDAFETDYKEIIFDNCVYGKVDKMLIGFQNILNLIYKIQISEADFNIYRNMCEQLKNSEDELIVILKLGGFEPYRISLFEELNVQKAHYIENTGGLSLQEKFPYYVKKSDQKDLIIQITQWAYKNNGGLWKNRKALVKISQ